MPLKKCSENGKSGWKWGDEGKCYSGSDGKKKAIKQGIAIEGPQKFTEMAKMHEFPLTDGDIEYALECAYAQCNLSFSEGSMMSMALFTIDGWTEELTEDNFVVPTEYVEADCECEDECDCEDIDAASLWENIRRKKMREGDNYKPAKKGDKDRPDPEAWKRAQSKELQKDVYDNPGEAMKRAKELGLDGIHDHPSKKEKGKKVYMPGKTHDLYEKALREEMSKAEAESYADHAEADKPGPKDPRRTPAPKKDQKKGSKKNKPDSAKDKSGKITFSKETTAKLSKKVSEHNAKGKGSKATLGMLKAVYRRGAGAYSSSHAPKMSRDGWAMARVNAFLTLLRTGRPSNSAYTQDNDLLPSSHPRSSKAAMTEKQKEALDKDKDGKITKKDFEMLRKSEGYGLPKDVVEKQLKKEHAGAARFIYENTKTGEQFMFNRMGNHKKDGKVLRYVGKADWHDGKEPDSKFKPKPTTLKDKSRAEVKPLVKCKSPGETHTSFVKKNQVTAPPTVPTKAAEYKGRKVTLNKPFRTPSGPKKFAVYTKNQSGNVVIVRFGDPNMKIKKNIPERRKSFRARHNCDNPGPKWKARYWSCRAW